MDFRRWLWFSPGHGNCSDVIVRKGACMMFFQWLALFHVAWGSGLAVLGLLLVKKSWGQVVSTCLLCGYVVRGGCHYYCRRGPALIRLKAAGGSQSINQSRLFWALRTLGAHQRLGLPPYPPAASWAEETKLTARTGNNAPWNIIICWNC